ncbi:ErfK/YbiS/YcfS/YnhG family protein [Sulfitobacter noctilucicola]|uniref:Murein L,D-transpeptidase YafK n=1 Tax=Sulfitobacter noctilucicola TaxID=1342301 RepID=A0A7W6Q488_9RHOB|nr:L,D-transpeptidase family protein [Sulfitobacter noctilucicola]KIN62797.1 ErfK/YbiS/YcfS/YnhG family protein [Sulfitobacter noctilucicola]MBB4172672.1 murein L,D-transpeptidase YafK [Sulfitobacter noctilucicola]
MKRRTLILGGTALVALGACGNSKFKSYNGPEVTYVVVNKGARKMMLLHHDRVLKDYRIKLGFAPAGHKEIEGDGRTPEGIYLIDRRNPNSRFHLSLGISYPNARDRQRAHEMGKSPGGDIFIHGQQNPLKKDKGDWTWGCISVTNKQMEDIYAMVGDGTPIQINP